MNDSSSSEIKISSPDRETSAGKGFRMLPLLTPPGQLT